jgi:hypothetical protein
VDDPRRCVSNDAAISLVSPAQYLRPGDRIPGQRFSIRPSPSAELISSALLCVASHSSVGRRPICAAICTFF